MRDSSALVTERGQPSLETSKLIVQLSSRGFVMAEIERRNIPPINPLAAIAEVDRAKVHLILRKRAADILTGTHRAAG